MLFSGSIRKSSQRWFRSLRQLASVKKPITLLTFILVLLAFAGGMFAGVCLKEPALKTSLARNTTLSAQLKQAHSTSAQYRSWYQTVQQSDNTSQATILKLSNEIKQLSNESTKVVYVPPPPIPPGLCANGQMEGGIVSCNGQ